MTMIPQIACAFDIVVLNKRRKYDLKILRDASGIQNVECGKRKENSEVFHLRVSQFVVCVSRPHMSRRSSQSIPEAFGKKSFEIT